MAVPALLYGSETLVMNQKDYSSLTAAKWLIYNQSNAVQD